MILHSEGDGMFRFLFETPVRVYSDLQYKDSKLYRISLELLKISTEKALLRPVPNMQKAWLQFPGKAGNVFALCMYYPDATPHHLTMPFDANYFLAISNRSSISCVRLYSESDLNYTLSDSEFNKLHFIGAAITPPFTLQQLRSLKKVCR